MKRCPTCQRTYPDDAPAFCVNDGAQLFTEESQPYDPQKTMVASAPPPPPPQYSPQPPPPGQPPQASWPPPPPQQQGQNWGGYYQQPGQPPGYAPQYGAVPTTGGKGLSLASFILGLISFAAVALIFMMSQRLIDADRDVAQACYYGSAVTGLTSIVLGALALISRRQRNKWMAILGLVLGIPGVLFFIYVAVTYGF